MMKSAQYVVVGYQGSGFPASVSLQTGSPTGVRCQVSGMCAEFPSLFLDFDVSLRGYHFSLTHNLFYPIPEIPPQKSELLKMDIK